VKVKKARPDRRESDKKKRRDKTREREKEFQLFENLGFESTRLLSSSRRPRESRRSRIGNLNKIGGHPTMAAASDVGNAPVSFGDLDKELEMTAPPGRVITVAAAKERGTSATVHSGECPLPPIPPPSIPRPLPPR
jgi:hypothetical protein